MPHVFVKGNRIGARVREARENCGLDQVELAAALEVKFNIPLTQRIISEIELGRRAVRDKEIFALAKVLNISPNDLFDWKP